MLSSAPWRGSTAEVAVEASIHFDPCCRRHECRLAACLRCCRPVTDFETEIDLQLVVRHDLTCDLVVVRLQRPIPTVTTNGMRNGLKMSMLNDFIIFTYILMSSCDWVKRHIYDVKRRGQEERSVQGAQEDHSIKRSMTMREQHRLSS